MMSKNTQIFKYQILRSNTGSGMVIGFFAMLVIVILGTSFLTYSMSSLITAKRSDLRARALSCAEAGLDKAIFYLMHGGPGGEEVGAWRTSHPSPSAAMHTNDTWFVQDLASHETFKLCVRNGSGITVGKVVVTSVGTATVAGASVSRTLSVVLSVTKENVSVWNNVIFGGVGQSGKSINGNVQIKGSVHLLGDGEEYQDWDNDGHWDNNETYTDKNGNSQYDLGELYTDTDGDGHRDAREYFKDVNGNGTRDPALTVTDLAEEISGNAALGNNYYGMSATLLSHVPTLDKTNYAGEMVDSLEAKLRVKHGRVNVSGSAVVGNANSTGNSIKETMDGVYVSDGFGGNAGAGSVHADNGTSNGYDLGDGVVKMPTISIDPYTDASGVTYTNYLAYLKAHATVVSGDISILFGTAKTITGPNGSLVIDASGNMTISGMVYVDGNISFGPKQKTITYSGTGTLVTPDSSYVHCNLLPANKFVANDTLGLICGDRIELATGSGDAQLTMAIAMYAQHKVISNKQSSIAGTIVSSYYEMSNVPSIYQVPDLATNLPPGMPGGSPIWISSVSIESWREL